MNYLYDIWVNWFDGEEAGFNVCPYHEWRKDDNIEMVDQIPVLYITKRLFRWIENSLSPIPEELLKSIYKKAYVRKGYGRKVMVYASIITDGDNVLAFDTIGYDMPFRKSRLIPRQERQVIEMCTKLEKYVYEVNHRIDLPKEKLITSLTNAQVVGLTRRERNMKKLLFVCLAQLRKTDNKKEISYWLSEWQGINALPYTQSLTIDEVWKQLYEQISNGWSAHHEKFLRQLIRIYPLLQHEWEKEVSPHKNKENQK